MEKKKKPAIRFKGFTDSWEQRKVGDFLTESRVRGNTGLDAKKLTVKLWGKGVVEKNDFGGSEHTQYFTRRKGQFIYSKLDFLNSAFGVIPEKLDNYESTADLPAFDLDGMNPYFMYFVAIQESFYLKHGSIADGSRKAKRIHADTFLNMPVMVPTIDEQNLIVDFLQHLDHLITLHQRKYDKLQIIKKAMLEKMFPQNGSCFPEIRFKGFTDSWEQRKFDKWGDFYYGHSCPKWSVTEDATIPCIRYGELYTKFGAKIDKVYSYTNMPTEKLRFSKGTEVLIPRVGEDPMDYNHCTWLSLKDVAIGEMISVFNTDQDPLFSATMFNATLQKEFAIRVEGGSVTNLYFDKLRNIDISYPLLAEQKKIAAFFENLDHLITLHQREVEKLQNIKKSMLETMFV